MTGLRKIKVSTGIDWVEVPEVGLRMLCGCPADSVKHLMRRGLIVPTEKDGVEFETGPNVILLSDTMIQKGNFCNMGEFPVLQMLYRQGMILPGHPNNKGVKPLLIGSREQVTAQMEYIYRGNYGLISKEEIMATGISPKLAHDLMRLKLRFAFGEIRSPRDLLDNQFIGTRKVEIRDGVMIERLENNIFEVSYLEDKVQVNLNLKSDEKYETAYPLDHHKVKREAFSVVHSGNGDGWDVNRPSMSSVIIYQGKVYLVDAGPNMREILIALGIGINEVEGIFQTHSHDDHFAGLLSFIRSDHKVKFFATPMVRASVTKKIAALMSMAEGRFTTFFHVHDLEMGDWNEIDGLEVMPILSPHPVETTVFKFRALGRNGYKTYAHFADIASFKVLEAMVTDDPDAPGISAKMLKKVKADYLTPATLKKLDIGGGMIHGNALDFTDDQSDKIILSHTALPLTPEQRRIGSGASFGTRDSLLETRSNYVRQFADSFLRGYLPDAPDHMVNTLLNHDIVTFIPETILLKEGQRIENIYLLLTGNVEVIFSSDDIAHPMSAGSLVGEISGLHQVPTMGTYRALSFVEALEIPCDLYLDLVKKNNLFESISTLMEGREFMRETWLLGEALSYAVQNRVAATLELMDLKQGQVIEVDETTPLTILRSGRARLTCAGEDIAEIRKGDFFGEDQAVFKAPETYQFIVEEDIVAYRIPARILADIPIIQWKLYETFLQRLEKALDCQKKFHKKALETTAASAGSRARHSNKKAAG
ncbi:cyclic nucleotide-binding domain-containing protein [Aestuariispira insulae]|uniref:Hemerythrin n=1 Tax=Aestuariispira insulae TaxID=1461337 RepID=A0A3D9HN08_9PROT|nr:cyclic nucleotide-binding domain-containing protein [Aestuariispira insulae]RED50785.1 hemerythrin [Aestuariispira insulae]